MTTKKNVTAVRGIKNERISVNSIFHRISKSLPVCLLIPQECYDLISMHQYRL